MNPTPTRSMSVKAVILEGCDIGELTPLRPAEDSALIEVGLKTICSSPEETEAHVAPLRAIPHPIVRIRAFQYQRQL
jgi:hypothetical protein